MSRSLDDPLDPNDRAESVIKRILLGLVEVLEANVAGARSGRDSECLHDLRVATRRTRSALGQIKDLWPAERVLAYQERFTWLQRVTGPMRDLDVYLLAFDGYRESLPDSLRPRLEPLRDFLISSQERERLVLAETLDSSEFQSLMRDWRAFLTAPASTDPVAANAGRPIKAVADERIRRLVKRVRREGRAIDRDSPPTQLHELRKSCKKLRYLIEFFGSLHPQEEIRAILKPLKRLLDQLGAYQDLAVQAAHLEEIAERMGAESKASVGTLLAMGALIADLLARRQAARDRFAESFAAFDESAHWRRYKALFWPSARDDGAA
ncbi:CHAD domain-containing protein [Thiocystis violacea]|uniref:CHAD domain-containing protein n=1 Tax=Thiocystis violacea TaxID=13725 RepID=UPI001906F2AC|nr:CHAD domain-containing protein [Thiocystis violacea]MBK1716884.1 metal-chelation protein CHAD [Thiocystis violacea]